VVYGSMEAMMLGITGAKHRSQYDDASTLYISNEILEKKPSWWTISSITRSYDPNDRLLNSSFLRYQLVQYVANENLHLSEEKKEDTTR
jgi:hypothetical protein